MRERHASGSPYEKRYSFSRAVKVGNRILVAGTAPIGDDGKTFEGDAYEQTKRCFTIAVRAIEALGGTAGDVVRTRMFLTDASYADDAGRAHGEAFAEARPAATMVVVDGLIDPAWKVEIEVEAVVGG
ncbi:MAG: RidA family protein [Planctomycetota bacterium]